MKHFKQKYGSWAMVTGATSGIGRAIAVQLAETGMNIILVARNSQNLSNVETEIQNKYSVETKSFSADLSLEADIRTLFTKTENMEVGILVHSAGIEENGAFERNDLSKEIRVIDINAKAAMMLVHNYLQPMVKRKKGGILLISSMAGHMPNPYLANYAGTKAYILNFASSLYGELRNKNISISVLSPGVTDTPMIKNNGIDFSKMPLSRMSPKKVAEIAVKQLGKKLVIIPGFSNRFMIFMSNHTPYAVNAVINELLMRKAVQSDKL